MACKKHKKVKTKQGVYYETRHSLITEELNFRILLYKCWYRNKGVHK